MDRNLQPRAARLRAWWTPPALRPSWLIDNRRKKWRSGDALIIRDIERLTRLVADEMGD